jgi:DNA-binding transcriptional ArsR family regulator
MPPTDTGGSQELDLALLDRAARTLRVLAHPVRLKMVELLLERPVAVGDLAERIDMAPAAVSQHLNLMRARGVVDASRQGRQVFYEVVSPQALALMNCLKKNAHRI